MKGEEGRSGDGWGWDLRSKGRSRWRYARHNRAGLGFLFCFSVKLYVCLLFRIEYFFSFLYRRYPLLAILGRVPVIRYGGQESAGGGDRCRSAVENGYLLSRVSLPLEATSPHQSSKLRLSLVDFIQWHMFVLECISMKHSRGSNGEGNLN